MVTFPYNGVTPPTRLGYTFLGWSTIASATTPLSSYTIPANSVTLYAVFGLVVSDISLTFSANGGTGGSVPTAWLPKPITTTGNFTW